MLLDRVSCPSPSLLMQASDLCAHGSPLQIAPVSSRQPWRDSSELHAFGTPSLWCKYFNYFTMQAPFYSWSRLFYSYFYAFMLDCFVKWTAVSRTPYHRLAFCCQIIPADRRLGVIVYSVSEAQCDRVAGWWQLFCFLRIGDDGCNMLARFCGFVAERNLTNRAHYAYCSEMSARPSTYNPSI
jgi:hypothetical protein